MTKATIVVREKDESTGAYAVLDIISFEVPIKEKNIKKKLDETLTRFFVDVHNKYSDISDIHIEFER